MNSYEKRRIKMHLVSVFMKFLDTNKQQNNDTKVTVLVDFQKCVTKKTSKLSSDRTYLDDLHQYPGGLLQTT